MQIEPSPGVSPERSNDELRASERRLREVIEALPAAVYTTDAEGRITSFNQAAVGFAGRVPELGTDSWCVSWKLFWPDGTPLPHDQCPMAIALKEGREIRGQEAVAERPDGTRVHFIPYPTPLRDALGKVVGAVNMLVDITARRQVEDALRNVHADLRRHTEELTRFNQAAVGRELRMIGLKKEVNELRGRLGELPRYSLEFEKDATVTAS